MSLNEAEFDDLIARTERFVAKVVIPMELDERCGAHGPSDALVGELRVLARAEGLMAAHLPRSLGGRDLSMRQTAQYFRAAGYSLLGPVALNIAAPDEGNMHLLHRVASDGQKARYLEPLARGEARSAFLMSEPDGAGSDPALLNTRADRDGDGWLLNGVKWLITGMDGARFIIVMARAEEGATMFLAPADSEGVRIVRVLDTIDRALPGGHAVVELKNVRVGADSVLGEVGQGFRYAQIRLAPARLTHCMRWLGAAERTHDIALGYAMRRTAHGQRLVDHQGVGFQLADNEIDLRQAALFTDWAAEALDRGEAAMEETSMAKVAVSEALYRVGDRSVQILGGLGVTDDTPAHQIFRELRAFRIYDGPTEVHKWSLVKRLKRRAAERAS
ncbi:MAG: putative acyl-CoA dehydrogenase [Alphaproteobacteria bacterium]|nr:MAG: putative acyl-CoA dehydrogenase [Alphaproteobacteria bacterium]